MFNNVGETPVKTEVAAKLMAGPVEYKFRVDADTSKQVTLSKNVEDQVVCVLLGKSLEQAERMYIEQTLASVGHNKSKAARILGVSRKTIHNKLKQYGPK